MLQFSDVVNASGCNYRLQVRAIYYFRDFFFSMKKLKQAQSFMLIFTGV